MPTGAAATDDPALDSATRQAMLDYVVWCTEAYVAPIYASHLSDLGRTEATEPLLRRARLAELAARADAERRIAAEDVTASQIAQAGIARAQPPAA